MYIFISLLVFISLFMTMAAGWMDITDQERIGCISKNHLWHDSLYVLLLAIFLLHFVLKNNTQNLIKPLLNA